MYRYLAEPWFHQFLYPLFPALQFVFPLSSAHFPVFSSEPVPLSAAASRGDQVLNAKSFKKQGFSYVIEEEELTKDSLLSAVKEVYGNRDKYKDAMAKSGQMDSIATIIDLINSQVKKSS